MEHSITDVRINNVRHLRNINIVLDDYCRKHLILTGKNGSGKTSVLYEIAKNLALLNRSTGRDSNMGLAILYNNEDELSELYQRGDFITAFFMATRPSNEIISAHGVEDMKLPTVVEVTKSPAKDIMKYMVHLKTQQSFAIAITFGLNFRRKN